MSAVKTLTEGGMWGLARDASGPRPIYVSATNARAISIGVWSSIILGIIQSEGAGLAPRW